MSNNQLPTEVQDTITEQADEIYSMLDALARDQDHYDFGLPMFNKVKEPIETALTEYATNLHKLQQENEKMKAMAVQWRPLLEEVFQKHECGLLPDRFVYDKIKRFLYGE